MRAKEPTIHSLQRTIQALQMRLARTDKKVAALAKAAKKAEGERDSFKQRYTSAVSTIRERDKEIESLTNKVDGLEKQVAYLKKGRFCPSSESEEGRAGSVQEKTKGSRSRGQQPGTKGHGRTDRSGLNDDHKDLDLTTEQKLCASCRKPFKLLPETDDSTLSEFATMLLVMNYHRSRYARQCKCDGPKIITAPPPPRLYPRTTIGTSLWVHLVTQKFLFGVPTNRTLKDLSLQGLGLAAGTVTGGFKIINDLVEPLYQEIVLCCQSASAWHADETSWRVFGENSGNKKTNRWWLWVVSSKQAVAYILDQSRSSRVPSEFFAASAGLLMSDRYSAYKSLPLAINKVWCWVHVRRDFLNISRLKKFRAWANRWLRLIAQLFVLNEKRFKLWKEERDFGSEWNLACKLLASHVEMMKLEWESQLLDSLHKQQKTILNSLKRHWDGLTLFLKDPCIPLHNNLAERLLRNCVVLRKASYGSGEAWAGHFAAKCFSIFQTWLINGLDPHALLLEYFEECSLNPGKPPPNIDKFLPWKMTEDRRLEFALPSSFKRPG
jgi:transposase